MSGCKLRETAGKSLDTTGEYVLGLGVMFRSALKHFLLGGKICSYDDGKDNYFFSDLFGQITSDHEFQRLTQSNKSGSAFRKGIYLSRVAQDGGQSRFNLLRCSTNFAGPTAQFAEIDQTILALLNACADDYFEGAARFNHVLAQVYNNSTDEHGKEHKAKISSHSDKTKDMDPNGLIAFVTFYEKQLQNLQIPGCVENDGDYRNSKTGLSVLTDLKFKLKDDVPESLDLVKSFRVKLYPHSVFMIPLSTNRYYTHEIVPPALPVDQIPTRLGYVVRCSNTEAIRADHKTYIDSHGKQTELKLPTNEERAQLNELYAEENRKCTKINYPEINFTFNNGDLMSPILTKGKAN